MSNHRIIRLLLQLLLICLAVLVIYLIYILYPFYKNIIILFVQISAPFLIAGLIAYLLHPIVEEISYKRMSRTLAILIIYFIFFTAVGLTGYYSFPKLVTQLKELQSNFPAFIESYRNLVYELYESTSFLPEGFHDQLDVILNDFEGSISEFFSKMVKQVSVLFNVAVMVAVIPILAFYFLKDYKTLQSNILSIIPSKFQRVTCEIGRGLEDKLGRYIRGQILVCFLVGVISYFLLKWIGIKYPLVLASIMGLTNFIPYFGPIIGAVPAVFIAFTESTKMVLFVILSVFIVQLIEGNLLSPYIVGNSVRIHPVYIIFTLFFAAEIGGIIAMIFAVPLLVIGKVAIPLLRSQVMMMKQDK